MPSGASTLQRKRTETLGLRRLARTEEREPKRKDSARDREARKEEREGLYEKGRNSLATRAFSGPLRSRENHR
ncbi:hypothetical protein MRX96_020909 [Rhipicephalus microplus]